MNRCNDCGEFLDADGLCAVCLLFGGLEQPSSLDMPEQIGSYRILRLLGSGGMGTVYEAEQYHPRRVVALKLIKPGLMDTGGLRRFAREAEVLARLNHPGIAQVFEAGTSDQGYGAQPYFAMELVQAVSLDRYVQNHASSTLQRLEIFIRICDAVQHAHERGIIHRDLKPANILIDEAGQCKILDFGIALITDYDTRTTRQTNIGQLMGTLAYMSPEQVLADPAEIDTRSDLYTLGVILYELLAGKLPYTVSRQVHQAVRTILDQDPVRLSSVNRIYRGDVEAIVAKALDKDKARRYASAAELGADIRRYLDDQPIIARHSGTGYQVRKFARRNKSLVGGIAAVFIALVIGLVASAIEAGRARLAEQAAVASQQRTQQAEAQAEKAREQAEGASVGSSLAEARARKDRDAALRERGRADTEAASAKAVNEFLRHDVLAQASNLAQAGPERKPDPDLKIRTALDRAAQRIEGKFTNQSLVESSIRLTIGQSYLDLGLFKEAQSQVERALALRKQNADGNSADTALTMEVLGKVLERQGEYAQAEDLLDRALSMARSRLGWRNAQTLETASSLALAYGLRGKYTRAEKLFAETLNAQRKFLEPNNLDTLNTMGDLANLYDKEGKHTEAEGIQTEILATTRRLLGPEHPNTVAMMNNLANSYVGQRKYEQAEKLYLRVREIQLRVRGEEHPNTLLTLANLATVYRGEQKFAQSEQIYQHLLTIAPRVFGPEHPRTLAFMTHLGELYQTEGEYQKAEELLTKVLDARKRVLGEQHPDTIRVANELAVVRSHLDAK